MKKIVVFDDLICELRWSRSFSFCGRSYLYLHILVRWIFIFVYFVVVNVITVVFRPVSVCLDLSCGILFGSHQQQIHKITSESEKLDYLMIWFVNYVDLDLRFWWTELPVLLPVLVKWITSTITIFLFVYFVVVDGHRFW